ncbi:alanyl-tRNA synthetase [Aphelenchoides avenae]|nr:alanyl-tRNA synthetase [Aphelenchus avenae]
MRFSLYRHSKLTANQIRRSFIEYFQQSGHVHVPSSSVVPKKDPTLFFVNAGMNQFKPILLGEQEPAPDLKRVVNSQKCIRMGGKHNDLEDVGRDNHHHTFFEMLGNWSFGDYYKREACSYAWKYLTDVLGIEPHRLYVTYFSGDASLGLEPDVECLEVWRDIGVPDDHILPCGRKDNFWEMGETGPCGPCSEIHVARNPKLRNAQHLVNTADTSVVELWNIVFMQYNR